KPPTPKDSADKGDAVLATVDTPDSDTPPPNAVRQSVESTPIAGGLLTAQRSLPPQSDAVPGLDDAYSGSGSFL
ncbi:hypothetical protein, partial [Sphingomonas sp. 28-63-12]|uniref:hypothetical protein n=1 Tax=Sphingomonas sp. 28-63-12 TaxID=1970434 RepID=UPI000BD206D7